MRERIREAIVFWWQRRTRGFDERDVWALDTATARFMLPRLRRLREVSHTIKTPESEAALDELEWFLQVHIDDDITAKCSDRYYERYEKAAANFGKIFGSLWD